MKADGSNPTLEVTDLDLWREKRSVLRMERLELSPLIVTALVGPNGSGKSTLLSALAGLLVPRQGRIRVDGRDLYRADRAVAGVRRSVVLVHQRPVVFDRSVAANVAYGLRRRGIARAEALAQARAALEGAGLSALNGRPARSLSGGERRRVSLVRALLTGPKVLLLDEPSAEVDDSSMIWLTSALREAAKKSAVLLATHDSGWARELADRVVSLGISGDCGS